jgi:HAE1 family hydrophobic/amphiphilic exporter-1
VWFQTGFERLTVWYKERALPLALRHRWMTFWFSMLVVLNAVSLIGGQQAMMAFAAIDVVLALGTGLWFVVGRFFDGRHIVGGIRVGFHGRAALGAALGLVATAGVLVLMATTHTNLQTEFVPDQKTGQIHGDVTFPVGTPLKTTETALVRIEHTVLANIPIADTVRTYAGTKPDGWGSTDGGFVGNFNITLRKDKRREQDDVIAKLRQILPAMAPGADVTVSGRGGGGSGLPISYTLSGPPDQIQPAADKLAAYIRTIPGTVNVQTGSELDAPHITVRIDPARAAVLGVSPGAAATVARAAVGGVVATKVRTWNGLVNVLLQYPVAERNSIDEIERIPVRSNDGTTMVPLSRIASFTWDRAPTKIEHVDKQVIVRVNGDIDHDKTTLGEVTGLVNTKLKQPGFLPPGVTLGSEGDTKFFMEFLSSMGFALITSIALIYCLMVVLYGSFTTPLVIMFSIPVSIIGALFALALTHQTINIFSAIGLIMLFGLVAKNGILLVDYANTLRKRGLTYLEAIVASGGTRLRPIVMTTVAMVFGMLPLALGRTEGGEIRQSMGIVLIGGLLSSLFLTLFLVPAMYVTTNHLAAWWSAVRAGGRERVPARERRQTDDEPSRAHVPAGVLD